MMTIYGFFLAMLTAIAIDDLFPRKKDRKNRKARS